MEQAEQSIDSFLDSLDLDEGEDAGSAQVADSPVEAVPPVAEPVAPVVAASTEVSSIDPVPVEAETPVSPPPLDPELAGRLQAMEQQIAYANAEVAESREFKARLQAVYDQQQRDVKAEQFRARMIALEDLPEEHRRIESARLVAEVERETAALYEPHVQQSASDAHVAAAYAAAQHQVITNRHDLTEQQKKEIIEDSRYLGQMPNPAAQDAALKRDQRIISTAVARARAEWDKANATAAQTRVQGRAASGADDVGSAVGSGAARANQTIDDFVDSLPF